MMPALEPRPLRRTGLVVAVLGVAVGGGIPKQPNGVGGQGGDGGVATASVSAHTPGTDSTTAEATQRSGSGGDRYSGRGDGADSSIIDAVSGSAAQRLDLIQNAYGGSGGNATHGPGGIAGRADATTLAAGFGIVGAVSGPYGGAGAPGPGTRGGVARAESHAISGTRASASSKAIGGNWAAGGRATAIARVSAPPVCRLW